MSVVRQALFMRGNSEICQFCNSIANALPLSLFGGTQQNTSASNEHCSDSESIKRLESGTETRHSEHYHAVNIPIGFESECLYNNSHVLTCMKSNSI